MAFCTCTRRNGEPAPLPDHDTETCTKCGNDLKPQHRLSQKERLLRVLRK